MNFLITLCSFSLIDRIGQTKAIIECSSKAAMFRSKILAIIVVVVFRRRSRGFRVGFVYLVVFRRLSRCVQLLRTCR
jgi:hypothetical protein